MQGLWWQQISHSTFNKMINKEMYLDSCWAFWTALLSHSVSDCGYSRTSFPWRAVWQPVGHRLYWQKVRYDRCSSCCRRAVRWRTPALQEIWCSTNLHQSCAHWQDISATQTFCIIPFSYLQHYLILSIITHSLMVLTHICLKYKILENGLKHACWAGWSRACCVLG